MRCHSKRILALAGALLLTPAIVLADEARQTDWCGGGGEPGPVVEWADTFDSATGISWMSIPGQLALSSTAIARPDEYLIDDSYYHCYGLFVTDMDDDGDPDVVGTAGESNRVMVWVNQGGDPISWEEMLIDDDYPGGTSVHPIDMDDDGDLDVVAAAESPGNNVSWWKNEGGDPVVWTRQTIDPNVPIACNVFAADVDGDEDVDVLSTSWSGAYIAWWENLGGDPISWRRRAIRTGFAGGHSAFATDMDNDDDIDVLGTAANLNQVSLFVNEGGSPITWTEQVIDDTMVGVRYATGGDVDGDGLRDIVATGWDGQLVLYRNGGGEPIDWTRQLISDAFAGGHYVYIADLNGDGAEDVLVVAWGIDTISWFQNMGGDPIVWSRHDIDDRFTQATTAFPGDVNMDGALEVVATSMELGEFVWWDPTDFVPAGELDSSVLDTGGGPQPASLDWTGTQAPGTDLYFQVRSSDDPANLGPWSAAVYEPGDLTDPIDRYVQYRVTMESTNPVASPILQEVRLSVGGSGAVSGSDAIGARLLLTNPILPASAVSFHLPGAAHVRISLHDLNGREVGSLANRTFGAGRHTIATPRLPSGVYLCRMASAGRNRTARLVVVD